MEIEVEREFAYPCSSVFAAWLDPKSAGQWLFATPKGEMQRVEIAPRLGGGFIIIERREGVEVSHFGKFTAIDKESLIQFNFSVDKYEPDGDLITVHFEPIGKGCRVRLIHEMNDQWMEYAERTRQGWEGILEGLEKTLRK